MFLFIDESEDSQHFLLAGIMVKDCCSLEDIIYEARRRFIRNQHLKRRELNDLHEFHEYILNDKYPRIKQFILERLADTMKNNHIPQIHAVYFKKPAAFKRDPAYLFLALELLKLCEINTNDQVIFDGYGNKRFQAVMYDLLRSEQAVPQRAILSHCDSRKCKPIQVVDCVAGCLRRSLIHTDHDSFKLLQPLLINCIKKRGPAPPRLIMKQK